MNAEEPISDYISDYTERAERAKAVAKYWGLSFQVEGYTRVEYRGFRSEDREATEEEMVMWNILDNMTPHTEKEDKNND
jgi:hypothetical protein